MPPEGRVMIGRYDWLREVGEDTALTPFHRLVCMHIGLCRNNKTGRCDPGYGELAKRAGGSQRAVVDAVKRATERGWLRVERLRGRRTNNFVLCLPDVQNAAHQVAPHDVHDVQIGASCGANGICQVAEVIEQSATNSLREPLKLVGGAEEAPPYKQGERETREGARSIPPAAARAPDGGAAAGSGRGSMAAARAAGKLAKGGVPHHKATGVSATPVASLEDQGIDKNLAKLRAVWTRPWPDNDDREARRAFNAALDEGTDAETILAAARDWVRCADAPRFLPKLSNWLAARGWEKEPPQRRARAQQRRSGGHRVGRTRGQQVVDIALRMGGYVEQADGSMACVLPNGSTSICNWGGVR
jgi:hypothetical protein